ncbi:hypothetical protein Y1Q_0002058 [Alligator mississippiensis]|uniref:Collagen alpha-1(XXV) chain n=1 Tax=Alligator mississippiensis TaxID=8496 RepID=A0A151MIX6_ALLMI|nr:hypothetical protein Y1Q_0002058 [Alligator mississippiensis]
MGGGGKDVPPAAGCPSAPGTGTRGHGAPGCCPARPPLLTALLSVLAAASCVYLGLRTSQLQARVSAIESSHGGFSAAAAASRLLPGCSLDQLQSVVQEKVERLLAQKSYEHLAKIRIAREVPPECNCPPGLWICKNVLEGEKK